MSDQFRSYLAAKYARRENAMNNVLRVLIYNDEVSLTVVDTTAIVKEGIRLHTLSPASAYVYGKAISALTFASSGLKEEKGELSFTVQMGGEGVDFCGSGNKALFLRAFIGNPRIEGLPDAESEKRALGTEGAFTLVRDDGYNRPFVGTCAFPEGGGFDEIVEEYYRVSEQLPTRIKTVAELDEKGECSFAGAIALQPLPFASKESLEKVEKLDLNELLKGLKGKTAANFVRESFQVGEAWEERLAEYKCNCSREYLAEILVSLGKKQFDEIIQTEGAVEVHCHYCNRDYRFTAEDAERLFPKK